MSAPSPYLRRTESGYMFRCPGCDEAHHYAVDKPQPNGAQWSFNGDVNKPTFSPSLLIKTGRAVDPNFVPEEGDPPEVCHLFVTDGQVQFCSDSTHKLAGQTVPLPKWWREE